MPTFDDTRAPSNATLAGLACGAGAGALWGLVFLAPEIAPGFRPIDLTVGRYLAYGIIAGALIAPRLRRLLPRVGRRDWLDLAWLSLAGNTLYYILLSTAVQSGGVAMTSLVIGFLPVAVTVIGSREAGAVPLRKLWLSLLCCSAGAICIGGQVVATATTISLSRQVIGLACAVGALASWTSYAVGNSRSLARLKGISAHDWSLLTGVVTGAQALVLAPCALLVPGAEHGAADWTWYVAVSAGIAVLSSVTGNALWNRMSRLLPLTLVGQMILFETLFALFYGFLWEQRLPRPLEMAAFALVVVGVVTCLSAHRKPAQARKLAAAAM